MAAMANSGNSPFRWCCYLLICSDGSYYCGITSALAERIRDHFSGRGLGYTKAFKPVWLVWYEVHRNRHSAAEREKQFKSWSRDNKRGLAEGEARYAGMGNQVTVSLG
jgi:predicted GIY-YIG superfamily endonuclease